MRLESCRRMKDNTKGSAGSLEAGTMKGRDQGRLGEGSLRLSSPRPGGKTSSFRTGKITSKSLRLSARAVRGASLRQPGRREVT